MSKLTVWNPWRVFPRDFMDVDDWDDFGYGGTEMDLYEEGDNVVAVIKAPGFDKDSIDIEVVGPRLTLSGKMEKTDETKDRKYYRKEVRNMSFTRTVDLPVSVDSSKTQAVFKNGILTITMPKTEESKPKKISVQ